MNSTWESTYRPTLSDLRATPSLCEERQIHKPLEQTTKAES